MEDGDKPAMEIIECVPNFSEGKNISVISAICREIKKIDQAKLLDVYSGKSTNRTVITFVGSSETVLKSAFQSIKKAVQLIDMRRHHGVHPRIGAIDVFPFVPLANTTMKNCIELAHRLGKQVGENLKIPVYLYEKAATCEKRRDLSAIRKGEYENLPNKLNDPEWKPDYGPSDFNPKIGAIAIGARNPLIAFNVNLNTKDGLIAHQIAVSIRESGQAKRNRKGKPVHDSQKNIVRIPGKLKSVKAIGWYIEEYGIAQISMNLVNYKITPPHLAFEAIREEAEKMGYKTAGSELIGLIPKEAMLMAGHYYTKEKRRVFEIKEKELIQTAILNMGLNQFRPFHLEKKIIEYQLALNQRTLSWNTW